MVAEKPAEAASWADAVVDELIKTERKIYVCEGMWTPSGYFHIGNARPEIFTPYSVFRVLENRGYKAKQNFIIDDFDAVRKIPLDLNLTEEQKKEYLGIPCALAPSPLPGYKTWAEAFVSQLKEVIHEFDVPLNIYSAYEIYKSGKLNDQIKFSLDHAAEIVKVWNGIAGTDKEETFLPIQIFCDSCNKIFFTEATEWDGKEISYKCKCGHTGKKSPYNGNAKLHWRVHWAAFWIINDVAFESAGKDHFSKGGSVDVGQAMMKTVFKKTPPYQVPTEFVQIGGAKMAGSVGNVIDLKTWLSVASPELFRYLNFSHHPNKGIDFSLTNNSFILLNDRFERAERIYYGAEEAENEKVKMHMSRAYELSKIGPVPKKAPPHVPFSYCTQLSQLIDPKKDFKKIVAILNSTEHIDKKTKKSDLDALNEKLLKAKHWAEQYAPEESKLAFAEKIDDDFPKLTADQKSAFSAVSKELTTLNSAESIQQAFFDAAKANNLKPADFFRLAYLSLICKTRGPKIGSLILALGAERAKTRFSELS